MLLPGSPKLYIPSRFKPYTVEYLWRIETQKYKKSLRRSLTLNLRDLKITLSLKPITRALAPVLPFYILWYGYKEPAAVLP